MLQSSSEGKGKEPRCLNIFDLVYGIEIQSGLFFRLSSGKEENSRQGGNRCSWECQTGSVSHFLRRALNRVADSLHNLYYFVISI